MYKKVYTYTYICVCVCVCVCVSECPRRDPPAPISGPRQLGWQRERGEKERGFIV